MHGDRRSCLAPRREPLNVIGHRHDVMWLGAPEYGTLDFSRRDMNQGIERRGARPVRSEGIRTVSAARWGISRNH